MVMVKKRLLNILLKITKFENKIPKINAETCQKKKKKQKENIKDIDIETGQKIKKEANRVLQKL